MSNDTSTTSYTIAEFAAKMQIDKDDAYKLIQLGCSFGLIQQCGTAPKVPGTRGSAPRLFAIPSTFGVQFGNYIMKRLGA